MPQISSIGFNHIKYALIASGIQEQKIEPELITEIANQPVDENTIRGIIYRYNIQQPLDITQIQQTIRRVIAGCRRRVQKFDSKDETKKWFDSNVQPFHLLFLTAKHMNQPLRNNNLTTWVQNTIIDSGVDEDFSIDDIVGEASENTPVNPYQLADLTHKINQRILVPNDVLLVISTATGEVCLCDILAKGTIKTNAGVEVPLIRYQHQDNLGGNFATAYMDYITLSTHAEEVAKYYFDLVHKTKNPRGEYEVLAKKVFAKEFDGLDLRESQVKFMCARLDEEIAHSDSFRFAAAKVGRRINRLRTNEDVQMVQNLSVPSPSNSLLNHLNSLSDTQKTQYANGLIETEAQTAGMGFSKCPSIILLPSFQQRGANYTTASKIIHNALISKLGITSSKIADWIKYFSNSTTYNTDISSASQGFHSTHFLDNDARDKELPGWKYFLVPQFEVL